VIRDLIEDTVPRDLLRQITDVDFIIALTSLFRQFDASGSPPRHAVIRGSEQNLVRSGRGQK